MKLDFVNKRLWFYLVSIAVIVIGLAFLFFGGGLQAGIDFTGGSGLTMQFADDMDQQQLREALSNLGYPEATVQNLGKSEDGKDQFFIRTRELTDESRTALIESLKTTVSPDGVDNLGFDLVSPVVARETIINGLYAIFAAAIGIFAYLWWAFRSVPSPFRYGLAALVALIHDVAVVVGVFALLTPVLGLEINTMFLIALLTVIGYSVNDTIVIFDRLRENILLHPNRRFADLVNISIAESLSRSINTSLTLLLTLMALLLFGGATIREFLLVLLIGVIAGTYSSIAVASQILVSWEGNDLGKILGRNRSAEPVASPTG